MRAPLPTLSAVALTLAALTLPPPEARAGALDDARERALELVNRDRLKRGRKPLSFDPALNRAAQVHAEDMLRRGYFSHKGRDGRRARQRYLDAGGSRRVSSGENIATCRGCATPPDDARLKRLQRNWMNSRGHRVNILRREFTRFGYGLAYRNKRLYAVQTFSSEPPARRDGVVAGAAAGAAPLATPITRKVVRRKVRKVRRKRLRWKFWKR